MKTIIEPTTERLFLRQWRKSDLPLFAKMNNDPEVMRHFPNLLNQTESDALAKLAMDRIHQHGWGAWAVEEKKGASFIGFVGLHISSDNLPFAPCVEIAWRLAKEHWGKGYATEAAREALKIGFEQLDLEEIVAFTPLSNHRSQRVMEKLRMQRNKQTFLHPDLSDDSPLKEHYLYRLTNQQWKKSHE